MVSMLPFRLVQKFFLWILMKPIHCNLRKVDITFNLVIRFARVRECPPWCSIVGAKVTVHQFFCSLHKGLHIWYGFQMLTSLSWFDTKKDWWVLYIKVSVLLDRIWTHQRSNSKITYSSKNFHRKTNEGTLNLTPPDIGSYRIWDLHLFLFWDQSLVNSVLLYCFAKSCAWIESESTDIFCKFIEVPSFVFLCENFMLAGNTLVLKDAYVLRFASIQSVLQSVEF